MQTGAVIAAAGLSSRMGDFKPMLKIGSASMAQRIIMHLRQAGVFPIVVVTGFRAKALEQHLSRLGVLFVRNERYETSDMFTSAKIGLSALMDKCDRAFFTPVDVPLFTRGTLAKLMDVTAPVVKPICGGKPGHPILLSCTLLPQVLAYEGDGGLRGALASCCGDAVLVDVDDEGILLDADTPDNFRALTKLHTQTNLHSEADIVLMRGEKLLDKNSALLLRLIDCTGTFRGACEKTGISSQRARKLISLLEKNTGFSLIERCRGGSRLTDEGRGLLVRYERYAEAVRAYMDRIFYDYFNRSAGKNEL